VSRKGIKEEIDFSRRRQCLVMYCISHDESQWMLNNRGLSVVVGIEVIHSFILREMRRQCPASA
jgi:hypothetical protein